VRYYILNYNEKPRMGADTRAFFIRVKPKYKSDRGLLEHEKTHVRQWIFTLGLHSLLYLFSSKYKLYSEIQAYREQLKWYSKDNTELFATYICERYNLKADKEEVLKRLS
jgi:hypothetical protein